MRPFLFLALLAGVAACAPGRHTAAGAPATASPRPSVDSTPGLPPSARALVEAVRARHGATWYRTLAFVQETKLHRDGETETQTWYEAAEMPGRLRIDIAPLEAPTTIWFTSDSTLVARGGRIVNRRGSGNPLIGLGFDVVFRPAAETLAEMAGLGIDTAAVRVDTWEGRPAVVVGGAPGDEASPQVWYDRERLVFVRLVEQNDGHRTDVRFADYEPLAGGWIAPRVEAYVDGVLVQEEQYRAIRAGVTFPEGTFDPARGAGVAWWTAIGYTGAE